MAYNPQNPNGQATAANSSPVVIASDQLPAGAALADLASNPTTTTVGAGLLAYQGATWDRLRTVDAYSGSGDNFTVPGQLAVGTGPGYNIRYNPANLGTAVNSATTVNVDGANTIIFGINTTTTGTFIFEGTADVVNWINVEVFDNAADIWVSGQSLTPTAGKVYTIPCSGYRQVRIRTNATLGATVAHFITLTNGGSLITGIDTGFAPSNIGYTLIHKDGEYSTQQTTTALWTPATGKKFVVTDITITTGGTTSGLVTLFDSAASTAYSAGTTPAVFRGTFAPSTTVYPGVVKSFNVPYVSTTANNRLHVTTGAAMTIYVQVNGYEI